VDPVALIRVAGWLTREALGKYLHDAAQDLASAEEVAAEGRAVVAAAEARMQRAQTLRSLGAGEVFPAGAAILMNAQGELHPRAAIVVVTKDDLVLLDADPEVDDDVLGRIPRSEIIDVRLLD
jgi:hypothetical protein